MKKIILISLLSLFTFGNEHFYLLPHDCEVGKKVAQNNNTHSHGSIEETAMYQVEGLDGSWKTTSFYLLPTLERQELKMSANLVTLSKSTYGNYHALVVNGQKENQFFTAITYIDNHGKPSKISPIKLTSFKKGLLEIEPNPLPREHDRYTALKTYDFILKFQGLVLVNQEIKLLIDEVEEVIARSDENGKFSITLPNNFQNVSDKRRENKAKNFILLSSFSKDNKEYFTSFRGEYHVNPTSYWQSIPLGFIIALLGFLVGVFIYLKRERHG